MTSTLHANISEKRHQPTTMSSMSTRPEESYRSAFVELSSTSSSSYLLLQLSLQTSGKGLEGMRLLTIRGTTRNGEPIVESCCGQRSTATWWLHAFPRKKKY
ncbi:hypothetical protein BDV29DRAFT_52019 [Aspergillus leporis]|uniref:Uncharacterized protein n=1 Tax=Aspergillus leporis TaxID=41062 RepID=A0A5N5WLM1_9EURO|nr:hypothetical protein BDV29DRAFT_52019 [Aspergillus leporis]